MKMEFKDKVVVITGGDHGIGKCTAEEFAKRGAHVCVIDINGEPYFKGDISDKETLEAFAEKVVSDYGHVDYLINNAPPLFIGIDECSYEDFSRSLAIGVTAAFYLTKLFKPHFADGAAIVNISSSRDRQSYPQTESYTAAKGGIHALTHSLATSLAGIARVNSISPGWIDHTDEPWAGADSLQHPVRRVGRSIDIANTIMFLCSPQAGFITGENICVDGGMSRLMIYHDDHGWNYDPEEYNKEFVAGAITE